MKINIEIDTAVDRSDKVSALAAGLGRLADFLSNTEGHIASAEASAPLDQKPTRTRRTKAEIEADKAAAEQPAPAAEAPAPVEQPVQTVAITRDEIKALGTKITQAHGAPAISAVGDLFKSFVDAEGNPARLSTVREADFPALVAKMQSALAKPAGTPVDQLFA